MSEVKRYEAESDPQDGPCSIWMEESAKGAYVTYSDYQKLVAENAALLKLLTDVSDNHTEYFNESEDGMYADIPLDYVSEINMYVSRDVNAENPFESTDAAIAEIKAQGVDELIDKLRTSDNVDEHAWNSVYFDIEKFAANLRAGRKG